MGAENSKTDVLCYNLPPIEQGYLDALKKHLGTDDITVIEKGPDDGDVVSLLKGPLANCAAVEIDRTDPEHKGLDGLQKARRELALKVRLIAFGRASYYDVPPEVDLEEAEPKAFRCG